MDWAGIIEATGVPGEFLRNRHGPCPLCGGRDRFRYDDKFGTGSYFCSGCGPGDGIGLIMKFNRWEFKETASFIERLTGRPLNEYKPEKPKDMTDYSANKKRLAGIKKGLRSLADPSPVTKYLDRRGVSDIIMQSAKNLYYHPGIKYWDTSGEKPVCLGEFPCMVAIVTCVNTPVTMHLTYLTEGGAKADLPINRKLLPVANRADYMEIKLFKPTYSDQAKVQMGIAEGIEDALAVTQMFAIPCWSVISTGNMIKWRPPEDISLPNIYGDNDEGGEFSGQIAAYTAARDLRRLGFDANVSIPTSEADWSAVLSEESASV